MRIFKFLRFFKFFFLSHLEKKLFWKAVFWMIFAKMAIPSFSFKKLQPYLGQVTEASEVNLDPKEYLRIRQVRAAIFRARKILPFHCQCLVTAICARKLLKDFGSSPYLYLGVAKEKLEKSQNSPGLIAHAWVKLGDELVTGQSDIQFTVVKIFA